jgi:hypothetical protein
MHLTAIRSLLNGELRKCKCIQQNSTNFPLTHEDEIITGEFIYLRRKANIIPGSSRSTLFTRHACKYIQAPVEPLSICVLRF